MIPLVYILRYLDGKKAECGEHPAVQLDWMGLSLPGWKLKIPPSAVEPQGEINFLL